MLPIKKFRASLLKRVGKAAALVAGAFVIWSLVVPVSAQAQVVILFPERQQERKAARWSLSDWLETKKKIAAQNFWLERHTNKFPVDLTLGLDLRPGIAGGELDLFALWLGLHVDYEKGVSLWRSGRVSTDVGDQGGALGLQVRLFGGNPQNTSLVIHGDYEYRHILRTDGFGGDYGGYSLAPELQIYLAPWLGVRGEWRYRFSSKRITSRGANLSGNGWSLVAFLEMGSIRFEGGWTARKWNYSDTNGLTATLDDGSLLTRVRFFF